MTSAAARLSIVPPQPSVLRIPDGVGYVEFIGYLLDTVTTETRRKPQWLEISAYKVVDGTGRYVLHFVGKSVLVHRQDSPCNTGKPTPFSKLPMDAEACRKCRPDLEGATKETIFEAEIDRNKVAICDGRPIGPDGEPENLEPEYGPGKRVILKTGEERAWELSAHELIRALGNNWNRPGSGAGTLSAPAQRLLDIILEIDPQIYAATQAVTKI